MKVRLPKVLLSAIMCAFAYAATNTAQAGYVSPTTIWKEAGEMQLGTNPDNVAGYTIDVKDGDTEATITKDVTSTSGLFVRDGQLTIGGTEYHNTVTINPNDGGQLDYINGTPEVLNVAGKDAVVVIDNATVTTDLATGSAVGGPDGNGTLIIQNGAKYDGKNQYYFFVGYKSYRLEGETPDYSAAGTPQQIIYATTNNIGDSRVDKDGNPDFSNRYEGTYTTGIGGTEFGKGVVTVTGNSEFDATGIREFCMAEGEVNILDNSSFTTSSFPVCIGYGIGATSHVNIEGDSVWNVNGQLITGGYTNSRTVINVKDATVNLNYKKGAYLGTYLDKADNGSTSEFNVLEGSTVNVAQVFAIGLDATAKLTVDSTSAVKDFGYKNEKGEALGCLYIGACGIVENNGTIDISALELDGGTLSHSGSLTVNNSLTLNSGVLEIILTEANQSKEAITLADGASISIGTDSHDASDEMVIRLIGTQNVKSGAKFIIFNQEVELSGATIEGVEVALTVEDGETVITLQEDIYVGRDSQADVLGAAAWGVQKSSQAFTGTLWGGRTNAVVVNTSTTTSTDNKGNVVNFTEPVGQTIAWGTAYGSFDRQSNCGNLAGADYSIYGGAMGVEHQFVSGSSIGGAIGYDWGKVSPFNAARFDQESMHAAVYGRAGQWKLGQNATVALDLSAAVGSTESKLPMGDINQDNLQIDARVSYIRNVTDKLSASVFAGVQYYAQEDASAARVAVSSMQNLRTMAGAGITYAATAKTTLFVEASVHNDAMRHSPVAEVDGFREQVASPGRLGGSITTGAAYQLNENWTLRGSYSFEGARHSTEHNVNAGAVYRF